MARRGKINVNREWPAWRYGPYGEAEIFKCEADVPHAWTKSPGEVYVPSANMSLPDRETLFEQLLAKDIQPHPTWSKAHMQRMLDDDVSTAG